MPPPSSFTAPAGASPSSSPPSSSPPSSSPPSSSPPSMSPSPSPSPSLSASTSASAAMPAPTSAHKRRRTDPVTTCASPASTLRHAVREALAQETSPRARQARLNNVYNSYRQRAIASHAAKHAAMHAATAQSKSQSRSRSQCQSHTHSHSQCQSATDSNPATTTTATITASRDACSGAANTTASQSDAATTAPSTAEVAALAVARTPFSTLLPQASASGFPGKGCGEGCEHYARKCWIKAACCDKYYACRRCHDEKEMHEIDRHATRFLACVACGDIDQPVAKTCRSCAVPFARYVCLVCKFFDDREGHAAYHCDGCGICRVGKGVGIDNHHCNGCGICVPIADRYTHPCRERSLDANCPICTHYLATSTDQVVFLKCGHPFHVECLNQHTNTSYTCPICHKSVTDMSDWYRELDQRLMHDVMPPEYKNHMSKVLCHDCDKKSVAPFHFAYHKCAHCDGYNTRVLHQFVKDESEGTEVHNQPTPASTPAVAPGLVAAVGVAPPRRRQARVEE